MKRVHVSKLHLKKRDEIENLQISRGEVQRIAKAAGLELGTDIWGRKVAANLESYARDRAYQQQYPKASHVREGLEKIFNGIQDMLPTMSEAVGIRPVRETWAAAIGSILSRQEDDEPALSDVFFALDQMRKRCRLALDCLDAPDGGRDGDPFLKMNLIPAYFRLWRERGGKGAPAQNKGNVYSGALLDMVQEGLVVLHSRFPNDFPLKTRGTIFQAIRTVLRQFEQSN